MLSTSTVEVRTWGYDVPGLSVVVAVLRDGWVSGFAWALTEGLESRAWAATGVLCDLDSTVGNRVGALHTQLESVPEQ